MNDVTNAPLTGHYYQLDAGTELPDGLGIIQEGCDIFPDSPHGPGHSTIYPTKPMTVEEFNDLYKSLPWKYGGKI